MNRTMITAKFLLAMSLGFGVFLSVSGANAQTVQQAAPQSSELSVELINIREYTVELIIFEYADGADGTAEIFLPAEIETPYFGDAADRQRTPGSAAAFPLDPAGEQIETPPSVASDLQEIPTFARSGVTLLGADQRRLTSVYERLSRLDAYRPLMHVAWRQPTRDEHLSVPIKLRRLGDPPLRLDGTIKLYLSRFLHLVVDLSLEDKAAQRISGSSERLQSTGSYGDNRYSFEPGSVSRSVFYQIKEDRIVKNGELRYFDHPKFGVIARIDRAEQISPGAVDDTSVLLPPND